MKRNPFPPNISKDGHEVADESYWSTGRFCSEPGFSSWTRCTAAKGRFQCVGKFEAPNGRSVRCGRLDTVQANTRSPTSTVSPLIACARSGERHGRNSSAAYPRATTCASAYSCPEVVSTTSPKARATAPPAARSACTPKAILAMTVAVLSLRANCPTPESNSRAAVHHPLTASGIALNIPACSIGILTRYVCGGLALLLMTLCRSETRSARCWR